MNSLGEKTAGDKAEEPAAEAAAVPRAIK